MPQPQPDIDSYSYILDSDEYLGYPSYNDYIDSYMWPEFLPFNSFDHLNEIQILEGENIFGNLFGNPILDMDDFILELPIPEDENIFGNIFGNYILGDENWDEELENNHSHGFYGFLFGYGFITSQEEYDEVFGSFHACYWNTFKIPTSKHNI